MTGPGPGEQPGAADPRPQVGPPPQQPPAAWPPQPAAAWPPPPAGQTPPAAQPATAPPAPAPATAFAPPAQPARPQRERRRLRTRLSAAMARLGAFLRTRRMRIAGVVLLVAGLFLGGVATGWSAHTFAGTPSAADTTVELVEAPTGDTVEEILVPDVRGMLAADAQQALADAGIPVDAVTVVAAPSALPADTVISQDPIGGSRGSATVTITVAVPGTMPELVGATVDDANQALLDLGVRAVQNQVYDPAVAEGTVLAVEPAAGSPLTSTATLTVAGPASSVFLSALDTVESACSSGSISLDGQDHEQSLYCSLRQSESEQVYLLDRQATFVTGFLGITDDSEPGSGALVRITGDGRVLFEGIAGYGASQPLNIPVAGVLRLEIRYTGTNPDASGQLGLGELRAVGSPQGIDALAAG